MKYYFRYEGTSAKVYKKSEKRGEVLIASFKYGIDAKEYVEFKNETM
jgi:hypothetical protein